MTRQITGVDRYAREIVRELDRLLAPGDACLALPSADLVNPIELNNINIVRVGTRNGHIWEQIDLAKFLDKTKALPVNLCNTAPLFNPGIVCIHDMNINANPKFYSKKFVSAYKLMLKMLCKNAQIILTDSHFSESEIVKYYPATLNRITVVPCGWQHITGIEEDNSILESLNLKSKNYYYAMSSIAPNKNLKWLVNTAQLNPGEKFVIAGGVNDKVFGEFDIPTIANVIYTGYLCDEKSKALMSNCKAFLYPTFYEGFGLPPMESMACGAYAIVSDTEVMHEIYGESVVYIDPNKPSVLTGAHKKIKSPEIVLDNYSWAESAKCIFDIMVRLRQV